ncbi:Ig-like domain-containing protein, partial [Cribrihabitans sp. XS_ASV171]
MTVDLTGLETRPEDLIISFDLIGLGDVNSAVSVDSVRLLGLEANDPPVATGETATTPEDTPVDIDILANDRDPNDDPLIVQIETDLGGATLVPVTGGVFRYTPEANAVGEQQITYRLFDGVNRSAPVTLTVDVTPVNDAPTLDPISDARVPQGVETQIQAVAGDVDNTAAELRFSLDAAPAGARIDTETGLITWTPDTAEAGSFTVSVTDPNGLTANRSFTLAIMAAPVVTVADLALNAGTAVDHPAAATDPDGDDTAITYSLVSSPEWLSIDADTGA